MKRIAFLSILLVLIGIFTYQFEEKGGLERLAMEEAKHKIIDEAYLGELKEISASNFSIKKDGEHFKTSKGILVDAQRLQQYLEILGKMKVKRYLKSDEISPLFFPSDSPVLKFVFSKGYAHFKLGSKLEFDQSFYMEVNQNGVVKQMIAVDSSPNEGTYDKTTFHKNPEKYLRFKTMILLNEDFFIDTHIFQREYMAKKVEWVSIRIENNSSNPFELLIPERRISPSPPYGLNTKRASYHEFISDLVNFTGVGWMKNGKLSNSVSKLVIEDKAKRKKTIEVFRALDGREGYFAHLVEEDKILSFNEKSLKTFLKKEEDFWELKGVKESQPKRITMAFPSGKTVEVKLKHGNIFEAQAVKESDGEPVNTAFKYLIDVISKEADDLTRLEGNENLDKSLFKLSWGVEGPQFHVMLNRGELTLVNKELGFMLHYKYLDLQKFGKELKDFFL
ncbi:MAG: hypothetical protein CME70_10730 [Halobacteriovorax sp.]|nr:hypothetical protein [Halobacteriovorax sp.]|tara:strand:- start:77579 stop:78925 length:1347 start_codon:yes stop_codon:yes gene_type:complete